MHINHWLRTILTAVILLSPAILQAQTSVCKDPAKHKKLNDAMWTSCNQEDPEVTYAVCWAFLEHTIEDHDNEALYWAEEDLKELNHCQPREHPSR